MKKKDERSLSQRDERTESGNKKERKKIRANEQIKTKNEKNQRK